MRLASLAGMANVRGAVVPILSVAQLLGQDGDTASAKARIVLLDRTPPLGLAVDEVMSFAGEGRSADRRGGPTQLFLDGEEARRLLDLDQLLAREFVGLRRRATGDVLSGAAAVAQDAPERREVGMLSLELAGQEYALPIEHVVEILPLPPDILTMPRSNDAALGVVPYRDGLLPLAALRGAFGVCRRRRCRAPDALSWCASAMPWSAWSPTVSDPSCARPTAPSGRCRPC
ncbi:MAG: chemotaxis protein CheW [Aliidongia sp.]